MNTNITEGKCEFTFHLIDRLSSQVQLAETRAGLLITVNTVILTLQTAGIGSVWQHLRGEILILLAATIPVLIVFISLGFSLWAITPNPKHGKLKERFVYSSMAKLSKDEFIQLMEEISHREMIRDYWRQIHGISTFANKKFSRLKYAVYFTILSIFTWPLTLLIVFNKLLETI